MSRTAIRSGSTASTAKPAGKPDDYNDPWENAERDYVNFPTHRMAEFTPPTRHLWIPESFFKQFYNKTGVTGPYMFMGGLTTYLWSKEIWVIEHEFYAGIELFIVLGMLVKAVGPSFTEMLDKGKSFTSESFEP